MLAIRNVRGTQTIGQLGCELVVYRVEPITARLSLWRWDNNSASRSVTADADITVPGFFRSVPFSVGAAVMVPRSTLREVVAATDRPDATLLDLLTLFDGRRVYSYDMTRMRPAPGGAAVRNRWEGSDLVVNVPTTAPNLVVVSFTRTSPAASELMAEVQPLMIAGAALTSPASEIRYVGAAKGNVEGISIVTSRATGDEVRRLLQTAPRLKFVGLDVLFRTGTIQSVDIARPPDGAPPPVADVRTRLHAIRRAIPNALAQARSPDDVSTGVIQMYDAFTSALPQDLVTIPRVWEHVNEVFLAELPWDAFFKYVSFANSAGRLEFVRYELNRRDPTKNIGEEFVFSYADRFLSKYPLTPAILDARIGIAEQYSAMQPQAVTFHGTPLQIDKVIADYYQLVGRFIASDVATAIERWQADGTTKLTDEQYAQYSLRLAKMSVYLPQKKGVAEKLGTYLSRGQLEKLWQRATDKLLSSSDRGRELQAATYAVTNPHTLADGQIVFYDITYTTAGASKALGHLLLVQPMAKVKYGYTVRKEQAGYQWPELQRMFKTTRFHVVTAGSYTEKNLRTSGLSAENGVIKNFHVTHKMDGFVAIRQGALEVFDLEAGLTLPGRNDVIRPIRSLRDFHIFMTWLRSQAVSGFQTHLLVKNNDSAIDPEKTSTSRRERRILLSMRDEHSRRVFAILDIPVNEAINFAEATAIVRHLLHDAYRYTVENAVNLDTGSFDILHVKKNDGSIMYSTPTDISVATNLLVIYQ